MNWSVPDPVLRGPEVTRCECLLSRTPWFPRNRRSDVEDNYTFVLFFIFNVFYRNFETAPLEWNRRSSIPIPHQILLWVIKRSTYCHPRTFTVLSILIHFLYKSTLFIRKFININPGQKRVDRSSQPKMG